MKQNKDLGFLIPVLDNNQHSNIICNTVSGFIRSRPRQQVCIFNSYSERINTQHIPLVHINQAKFFDGDLIVFDLHCLQLSGSFPLINKIYYYAQNIPWSNNHSYYAQWKELFSKTNLSIISANKYIHDMYNIVWSNSVGISEAFDYETVNKLIL
jgi:hypothetical protein